MWFQGVCILPEDVPLEASVIEDVMDQMLAVVCESSEVLERETAGGSVCNTGERFSFLLGRSSRRKKQFGFYTTNLHPETLRDVKRIEGLPAHVTWSRDLLLAALDVDGIMTPDGEWHRQEHLPDPRDRRDMVEGAYERYQEESREDWFERQENLRQFYGNYLACLFMYHY